MKAEVKKILVGAAILDRPLGGDLKFQERARDEGWQRETSPGRGYTKGLEAYSCGCLPHILYVLRSHILYTQMLLVLEAVSSGIVTLSSRPYIPATVHTGLISLLTLRRPFNTRLTFFPTRTSQGLLLKLGISLNFHNYCVISHILCPKYKIVDGSGKAIPMGGDTDHRGHTDKGWPGCDQAEFCVWRTDCVFWVCRKRDLGIFYQWGSITLKWMGTLHLVGTQCLEYVGILG